jgi:hypothetical protein
VRFWAASSRSDRPVREQIGGGWYRSRPAPGDPARSGAGTSIPYRRDAARAARGLAMPFPSRSDEPASAERAHLLHARWSTTSGHGCVAATQAVSSMAGSPPGRRDLRGGGQVQERGRGLQRVVRPPVGARAGQRERLQDAAPFVPPLLWMALIGGATLLVISVRHPGARTDSHPHDPAWPQRARRIRADLSPIRSGLRLCRGRVR